MLTPILLTILGACCSHVSSGDESIEAKWRLEYPTAAQKLDLQSRSFSAKGRLRRRQFGGTIAKTDLFTLAFSDDMRLMQNEDSKLQNNETSPSVSRGSLIQCETPEYYFTLSRPDQSTEYRIEGYGPNQGNPNSDLASRGFTIAHAATSYLGRSFLSRSQDPTFKLLSASADVVDGRELIRITYEDVIHLKDASGSVIGSRDESGTVQFDPALGWVIRRVDIKFHDPKAGEMNLQVVADYQATDPAPSLPSRLEYTFKIARSGAYQQMAVEFDDIRMGKPSDAVFRLSGYGLPDIPLSPQPEPNFYTWKNPLFWAALAVSVVSFVLLRSIRWRPTGQMA